MPKSLSVESTWEGGYACTVRARQFTIRVDEPEIAKGGDTGPQPTEVFLASLASCMTLAIHHVAGKRDLVLPDLVVKATGEYQGPKFARLIVEVTSSLDPATMQELVARAKGICYVSNTIRTVTDVEVVVANPD